MALALFVGGLGFGPDSEARPTIIEEKDFELGKDEQLEIVAEVGATGLLKVQVHIRTPLATAPLKIFLEGPDGLQVEKRGSAPLSLRYLISDDERVGAWLVRIDNVGKMTRLAGNVRVAFEARAVDAPTASPPGPVPSDLAPSGPALPGPAQSGPEQPGPAPSGPAPSDPDQSGPAPSDPAPSTPESASPNVSTPSTLPEATDGKILFPEDRQKIRAACRDRNQDVFVRLDVKRGTGGFFLSYRHVFPLRVRQLEEDVLELMGGGEHLLHLDLANRVLYLAGEDGPVFCRVRLFFGGA